MLSIQALTYYIGGRTLYDNVSLQIKPKEKIGLIGLNGTGKSTLFKLITNRITPNSGKINKPKDFSIGFLHQDLLSYETSDSIRAVAMQAFREELAMQKRIEGILKKIEENYTDSLIEELTTLQEAFATMGGYEIELKADQMLERIGFKTHDLNRPFDTFSGGWRMRVLFAKLLLEAPDLLLLDEPTNHLDIVSIQWVENYLKNYPGSLAIISHDRRFLDNITNRTIELVHQQLHSYAGNYSFYEKEKALRAEVQQNAYENQQKKIKQTQQFIDRFRAKSSKAALVQSRVKALERMDKVAAVVEDKTRLHVKFPIIQMPGKKIVTIQEISKSFGELSILEKASGHVLRGDRIALVGANGRGKSTLLNLIHGELPLDGGTVKLGHQVQYAFYAQHQLESLKQDNTVLQELRQAGTAHDDGKLRSILGAFLFRKEEVDKYVKVLSGGERARVALAKILALAPNFLLLDEPTNHLDMRAIEVLSQSLQQYEGTVLFVSHNRDFVQQVATKIWYLEDGKIKEYQGCYDEYVDWLQERSQKK